MPVERPKELCVTCDPGWPCPWCVEFLGTYAWELANDWEKRLAEQVLGELLVELAMAAVSVPLEPMVRSTNLKL